jgi:hypothetical protein
MKPFLLACSLLMPAGAPKGVAAVHLGIDMKLIAGNGHRKWAYGGSRPSRAAMVTVAAAIWLAGLQAGSARPANLFDLFQPPPKHRGSLQASKVPLPKPRPAEAPAAEAPAKETAKDTAKEAPKEGADAKPAEPAAPPPSACRLALTEDIAIAPSIPDIHGPGGCGGEDLVRLEAIVLPNKHRVALTPPAPLRCTMARALADWIRSDVVALAQKLGSEPAVLDNYDSYECRGFNRIPGAHLSEHGRANALDVRAIKLANGQSIALTDRSVARDIRESVKQSVCARFMTVLGPDSDWYHEEHIHLDLAERRNNYKICQWDVLDPLPQVAPLMPAERPDDAPPREVAKDEGKADGKKDAKTR